MGVPRALRTSAPSLSRRRTRKAAATLAENIPGCFEGDSHALLMAVYKDPENPLPIRLDAAKAAIAYEKPRLSAVEASSKGGGPILTGPVELSEASPELLRRFIDGDP